MPLKSHYYRVDVWASEFDRELTDQELSKIEELATIHTPLFEIAHSLKVGLQAFNRYLKEHPEVQELIDHARAKGAFGLRTAQWRAALNGNISMQMWLGRVVLGQGEGDTHVHMGDQVNVHVGDISPESKAHLIELRDAIYGGEDKITEVESEQLTDVNSNGNGNGEEQSND